MFLNKVIATLVCTLLLVVGSFTFSAGQENKKHSTEFYQTENHQMCTAGLMAAQMERRVLIIPEAKMIGLLGTLGGCNDLGFCVIAERIVGCGWVEQDIDHNNDGNPEVMVVWMPVVNEDNHREVYFILKFKIDVQKGKGV